MDDHSAVSIQHDHGPLMTEDRMNLFGQSWYQTQEQKAVVLIIHGIAEHSSRYADMAQRFVENGYVVEAFDLRGHGQSDGQRNYVRRFELYLKDVQAKLNQIAERYPDKPVYVFGHSMGGLITLEYYLKKSPDWAGAILSGPAVKISEDISPFLVKISGVISALFPKLPIVQLDSSAISRDPEVVRDYENDPLVYTGKTLARTGAEVLKATDFVQERLGQIRLPLLIMHGTADQLTDPEASRELYTRAESEDSTLKMYDGFYHEVFNEPEKEQVFADIFDWLDTRVP